ncbi:MAG: outer membrane protein assembly factor BamD [Deltaproteobacteria bacterium]|nr:outer membrane protein assembly factor BamD [Deltaproteobacteria bacterium]
MNPKIVVILALVALCSCTSSTTEKPALSTEDYFMQAEDLMARGKYKKAIECWQKVLGAYLSPQLNMVAELQIAKAHYMEKQYPEAAATYEDFLKQHPNSGRVPEAMYNLGMSYYQQRQTPDRDQTATKNALITFQNVVKMYPDTVPAKDSEKMIHSLRQELAEHELYVGNFYLRTKGYRAAVGRFRDLLALYPDFDRKDEVYFLMGKAYYLDGDLSRTVEAFNAMSHEYPSSPYVAEAQDFLASNRLGTPKEEETPL